MSRPFLTANWRRLALFNYDVPPALLQPFVPAGTELDLWQGRCYVSLVGFLFADTRLKGLPIPFHRTFEEVNLRFYVKRAEGENVKRGVVFIKEIVPRAALTWMARTFYSEPYCTAPMGHTYREQGDLFVRYDWEWNGVQQTMEVTAGTTPEEMAVGSEAEFITEHYWGYTRVSADRTNAYEVKHPRWRIHPVKRYRALVDFGLVYGDRFRSLNGATPVSVMLAEGSPVQVMHGQPLVHRSAVA